MFACIYDSFMKMMILACLFFTFFFFSAAAPKSQKKVKSEELSDLMPKAKAIRNFEPASSLEMRVQV